MDLMDWYKEWYEDLALLSSESRVPDEHLQPEDYGLEIFARVGRLSKGTVQVSGQGNTRARLNAGRTPGSVSALP